MLYDGSVIAKETNVISIADSKETLKLEEESRSKMLFKTNFPFSNVKPFSNASHVKVDVPSELPKYSVDKRCLEIANNQVLNENDRLLEQIISQDIVNIVVNSSENINASVNVNENSIEMCNKCLELEAELIKQYNMVEKDKYNKLSKNYSQLEQHCISLELAMQLNKEYFQTNNTSVNQNEPTFDQLDTCPDIYTPSKKLVAVTPTNKKKIVRFTDPVASSSNIPKVTNRPSMSSIGVKLSTSASRSKPSGNTKKDRNIANTK
ncbi:hypothetical protein Tco_0693784 [Tanacetum coccineum]